MSWHRAAHLVQSAVLVAIVADILWLMTRPKRHGGAIRNDGSVNR